jgi:multisubunit Na+/H+ antiporter MnhG subunit
MAGAVVVVVILALFLILLVVGLPFLVIFPATLALLAIAILGPMAFAAISRGGRGGAGVPSTRDASYDPVEAPEQQPTAR